MDDNPYRPPQSDISIQTIPARIMYDGKSLIVPRVFTFPAACIKTGAVEELEPQRTKKLSWYSPWLFLLIFLGLLGIIILVIIALAVRNNGVIRYQLSKSVVAARRRTILRNWAIFGIGVASVWAGVALSYETAAIVGGWVILLSIILGVVASRFLYAAKIDKTHIWLRGVPERVARALVESHGTTTSL